MYKPTEGPTIQRLDAPSRPFRPRDKKMSTFYLSLMVANYIKRQDTVSYKKQGSFHQIKNSVVGIPAI